MKERPMLFSAPMVRALLEGRKTQTRRIVKQSIPEFWKRAYFDKEHGAFFLSVSDRGTHKQDGLLGNCPYGSPGDRLWMRENFWRDTREPNECVIYSEDQTKFQYRTGGKGVQDRKQSAYSPDACETDISKNKFWKQKPSIFMPRWASRITLEITGVRVERVQDISESDAVAEGIEEANQGPLMNRFGLEDWSRDDWRSTAREAFQHLFYGINKRVPVTENPWVWVVEFKRVPNA